MNEITIQNLGWLVEEFNFLFKFKNEKYCEYDKTLANQIIASISKSPDFTNNEKTNKMLNNTLKTLEDLYPMLLKSA